MKNKFFLAIVALVFSSGFAFGQNIHLEYYSENFDFLSSTTLVNNNSYVTYMVATNDAKQLFVTELNSSPYLEPVSTNSVSFQMADTVFIKGGFFDVDDNIVVYGYINPNKNGIIIKITMSNGSAVSIDYIKSPNANTEVIDGCWSERQVSSIVYKTYDFIYANSVFMRIGNNLTSPAYRTFSDGNMRSVSWDATNKKHIVSGNRSGKNYVGYFGNATALTPYKFYELTLPAGYTFSEGSNRHVLSDEDSIVYLCQNLRFNVTDGDGLWISKINYISGQLYYSLAYRFGIAKVWILDATKNSDYLFVLGHHNGTDTIISGSNTITQIFERRFIAQFNMYDTTDYAVKFMSDYNLTNVQDPSPQYPTYDIINTLYLNNITYNPNFETVFSSGAVNDKSYIVETYDLNYDTDCDSTKNVFVQSISPVVSAMPYPWLGYIVNLNLWGTSSAGTITNYGSIAFSRDIICPDYYMMTYYQNQRIAELQNRNFEKSLKEGNALNINTNLFKPKAQLEIVNNCQFICKYFEGDCYFMIYDLSGRLINEGVTRNEELNSVPVDKPGIYFISVRDSKNQTAKAKIMISN